MLRNQNLSGYTGCGKSRVARPLLALRFCGPRIRYRFNHNRKTRTGKSACATKTRFEAAFSAACKAALILLRLCRD